MKDRRRFWKIVIIGVLVTMAMIFLIYAYFSADVRGRAPIGPYPLL